MTNLDAGLNDDPTRRRATVAQVTAFLRARPAQLNPGPPADPVQAGKAWPSPRSWTNVIEALSQLRPDDEMPRRSSSPVASARAMRSSSSRGWPPPTSSTRAQ